MTRTLSAATLAAAFALVGVAEAQAWDRKSAFNGPRGGNSLTATGDCGSRACTRDATATGAGGRTATRTGDARCADGSCSGSRTTTGPAGKAVNRTVSLTR